MKRPFKKFNTFFEFSHVLKTYLCLLLSLKPKSLNQNIKTDHGEDCTSVHLTQLVLYEQQKFNFFLGRWDFFQNKNTRDRYIVFLKVLKIFCIFFILEHFASASRSRTSEDYCNVRNVQDFFFWRIPYIVQTIT